MSVGDENAPAADDDHGDRLGARLHAVDLALDALSDVLAGGLDDFRVHVRRLGADVDGARGDFEVGRGQRVPAETLRLLGQLVADALGADGDAVVGRDDGAAADADGDDVGHAEVGLHLADFDGDAALAGEALGDRANVGGRAAHVDDDAVFDLQRGTPRPGPSSRGRWRP